MAAQNTRRETVKMNVCTEWMELESDPGLFTLLLEDMGVEGVKVEEVYDVTQTFEDPVYGYVFLFQWVEERRVRKKAMNEECYITEPTILKKMFFAHQIVTNSCATHALLSIMLNCEESATMSLGTTLQQLKLLCKQLDPENRGYAIGNTPELAIAHNQHAKPCLSLPIQPSKRGAGSYVTSASGLVPETFHFVSYVPIGERLFELDGLKQWPIDHGPWGETENWTDLFKRVISKRLTEGDGIQFNLMALLPDPLPRISLKLDALQTMQKSQLDHIFQLAEMKLSEQCNHVVENGNCTETNREQITKLITSVSQSLSQIESNGQSSALDDSLKTAITQATLTNKELELCQRQCQDELETRRRYKFDAQRRTHDYDEFFIEYFKALAIHKLLPPRMLEVKKTATNRRGAGRKRGGFRNKRTNGLQRNKTHHAVANGNGTR